MLKMTFKIASSAAACVLWVGMAQNVLAEPPAKKIDFNEKAFQEEPSPKKEIVFFNKGEREAGLALAASGNGSVFFLGFVGSFGYFLMDKLAVGVDVSYSTVLSEERQKVPVLGTEQPLYADQLALLPLIKYVLMRSERVSPYVFLTGGREFQWGAANATPSWIMGFGGGIYLALAGKLQFHLQLAAHHNWFDNKKVVGWSDADYERQTYSDIGGYSHVCTEAGPRGCSQATEEEEIQDGELLLADPGQKTWVCHDQKKCPWIKDDDEDIKHKWFFPLITFGLAYAF